MNRQTQRTKRIARVLAVLLIAALLLSCVGYLFYAFAAEESVSQEEEDALAQERLSTLPRVLQAILKNYRDKKTLMELVNAAYDGVFDSLDRWSEYYSTPEEEQAFENALNPNYSGVGITLEATERGAVIAELNPFGPAQAAGVPAGGLITAVDGEDVTNLPATEIAARMRGEAGTAIALTVEYGGQTKTYDLTRQLIPEVTVSYRMLEEGIGYIQILQLSELTDAEFLLAHTELINQGAKGLVLDLRGNGGGMMDAAAEIAEELMPAGVIATYVRQGEVVETLRAEGSTFELLPLVVLIDEDTASAAEMLAGALQDSGAATVVGTVSYGKGVAQGVVDLGNEDAMKLSLLYFVTPNGHYIEQNGIKPDVIVYNGFHYTQKQIDVLTRDVIPMDEGVRYHAGESGRNVLAAQQRLDLLGYDVEPTQVMDADTIEAIKLVQKAGGGTPYGGLDFGTMAMIEARYQALCTPLASDRQLEKAVEILQSR